MPRLREAQIPFGQKAFKSFLKLANLAVIIFGIMTVVMSFEVNPIPTFSPGWCGSLTLESSNVCMLFSSLKLLMRAQVSGSWIRLLILLGATTMLGGMTGFGGTTLPCCYKSHVILMAIAIFGTGVFCLCMFGQRPKVVASFKSTRFPEATVDQYLSSISWVYVFVVIIECVTLIARVFFQRRALHEQFETLAQTQNFRETSLGKIRKDLGGRSDKVETTRANNLDAKMQDKYAKYVFPLERLDTGLGEHDGKTNM